MSATFIFLHLAGYVALLLWGMHMVRSGIVRAFGGNLRQALGIGLEPLESLSGGCRHHATAAKQHGHRVDVHELHSRRFHNLGADLQRKAFQARTAPPEIPGRGGKAPALQPPLTPFRKECLLAGADEVAFTLSFGNQIDAFEQAYERKISWL